MDVYAVQEFGPKGSLLNLWIFADFGGANDFATAKRAVVQNHIMIKKLPVYTTPADVGSEKMQQ
jgi:hypothetical protein